jgi:glucosamine-6-phosphate deaminase
LPDCLRDLTKGTVLDVSVYPTPQAAGTAAASAGIAKLREALQRRGTASIILATGTSQFDMLAALVAAPDIDWTRVTCFHLDEYIGLPVEHGASFRRVLRERFIERLPAAPAAFHEINGEASDPEAETARLDALIAKTTIDVAFIGIGENGHLAFNDPPADFDTDKPYLVVTLDEACRRQQMGEGWFATLDDVPSRAISMSIRRILASTSLIVTVPDERKADAVVRSLEGPLTNEMPASILRSHADCRLFLDEASASRLGQRPADTGVTQ